jgi:hypothetical protein
MTFINELREWGLGTAWHNFRFRLGYRIGGFTSARRSG